MSADDLNIIRIRIPDSRPDGVRKMCGYAYTLKCELLKGDFMRLLQAWKLSGEDAENLLSVMQRYPKYAINEQQMKWLKEYQDSLNFVPDASASAKETFRLKYGAYFENVETFLESLKEIKGKELKAVFNRQFGKSNISLKDFFADCETIVPERKGEKGWNYEAVKKY